MALPKLLQKLFQNDGVGPLLRSDILPIKTVNGKEPDSDGNIAAGDALNAEILAAADKALETVTNVGNTDIAGVLSAVASVEANLSAKLETSTVHIVETWSDGTEWYRVWSDGWIEQGGIVPNGSGTSVYTKTFVKAFSNTNYTIVAGGEYSAEARDNRVYVNTATSFCYCHGNRDIPMRFYACGY